MYNIVSRLLITTLGCLISAVAINALLVPHELLSGGMTGIAIILYFLFHTPIGLVMAIGNIPLFIIAWRLLDREFVLYGLFGMIMLTLCLQFTTSLTGLNLVDDILMASIYGGVIAGIGYGLIFRANANTGGTDIVGLLMKKFYSLNIGMVSISINIAIMCVAGALFGIKPAMYTLLSIYISGIVLDQVVEGFNRSKTIMIISEQNDAIAEIILNKLTRGVTFLSGEGAYSHNERKVLLCVVSLTQLAKVRMIVEQIDSAAFMIIQDAAEVRGLGFK